MNPDERWQIEKSNEQLKLAIMELTIATGAIAHILITKGVVTNKEYESAIELVRGEVAKRMPVKP